MRKISIAISVFLITATLSLIPSLSQTASAVSASDWVAGNIIDDTVFTDASRLSVNQIQEFLNAKVPHCDTWGTQSSEFGGGTRAQYGAAQGNPAPFTCLRDYYEVPKTSSGPGIPASNYGGAPIPAGAKSAAQLIYDSAQKYQISPAVLLVKLGTESAGPLTSDDWPLKKQFNYAMGAHCPDTGPGGSANCDPNWSGFSLQMDEAAKLLRGYIDGMDQPWWSYKKPYQNNYILWNVVERGCGGSNVYIQNKSTAALYTYTPYQPNAAALNNLYGTGDNCSAYGNRNFWRVYNDWFGSSTGSIIRTQEDGKMYVRGANNTYYYVVSSQQLYALGYGGKIKGFYNTTRAALQNMTFAGDLPNTVRINNGNSLYAIDGGQKHYFDYATWEAYGKPAAGNLSGEFDQLLPDGTAMSSVIYNRDDRTDLYAVERGARRYIGGPEVFKRGGYDTKPLQGLTPYLFFSLPKAAPILDPGTIIKTSDTNTAYTITPQGTKRSIDAASAKSIDNYGFSDHSSIINMISDSQSSPLTLLVRNTQGDLFIVDGSKKVHLNSQQFSNLAKTISDFVVADDVYLRKFTTITKNGNLLVKVNTSDAVYEVSEGKTIHIQTGEDFTQLGYSFSNVISLSSNSFGLLFTSSKRSVVVEGTLFRVGSDPKVYILGTDKKAHRLMTGSLFEDFNFNWQSVRSVSAETLAFQQTSNNLTSIIRTPDNAWWLVSNGMRYWISEDIRQHFVQNNNSVVEVPLSTLSSITPSRNATRFLRIKDAPEVYYLQNGSKHALSPATFSSYSGDYNLVRSVSEEAATTIPTGPPIY